ncbi:hypothetical protein [Spirosoma validum]|uniref:Uncharacterized protein n=1 Tax=Spirosoma validum TaxID=2771355 RepID=A0A927GDQ7_9BACT|nr:hypothetical protein [Spirosoma validum]MBD2753821.1 hypothetical protein [Spirosoma validum]
MLSYIELMNRFWKVDEEYSFSGNDSRLYFYLLNVANRLGWPNEFDYADDKLKGNIGIKVNTLKPCRDRLVMAGLLDFELGGMGRGNRVRYQLRYQKLTPISSERYQERCQERHQKLTPKSEKVSRKVSKKVSKNDTNSVYIRLKTFFKLSIASERKKIIAFRSAKKRVQKVPLIPRVPPKPSSSDPPKRDPFFFKSNSEELNVKFSDWYKAYQYNSGEFYCRRLWVELTDGERATAMAHTPLYVKSTPEKRYRKIPSKYLEEKAFNDEIIERNGKSNSESPATGQREIIRTNYTAKKFTRSVGGRNGQ